MKSKILLITAMALICAGCSLSLQQKQVQKTIGGVNKIQVMAAAQQAVIEDGFDVESVDFSGGTLVTAWKDSPRRSVRYEVVLDATQDPGPVTFRVFAWIKDRQVGGWSDPYEAKLNSNSIANCIAVTAADQLVDRTGKMKKRAKKQKKIRADNDSESLQTLKEEEAAVQSGSVSTDEEESTDSLGSPPSDENAAAQTTEDDEPTDDTEVTQ